MTEVVIIVERDGTKPQHVVCDPADAERRFARFMMQPDVSRVRIWREMYQQNIRDAV